MNRVLPYGGRAVLLEVGDTATALGLYRAVIASGLPVVDAVPAAKTVLVRFADEAAATAARAVLAHLDPLPAQSDSSDLVTIPVTYDGADLDSVARLRGLSSRDVVALHTGPTYAVGFLGFAPGFAYLLGLDPRLHLPRLDSPRTSVPAGSVAIAGPYAAVYPTASPGGWRLLGRTDVRTFVIDREPPALLRPGTRVRFVEASPWA
jgi:KipI family sensor histidine kinase inhibitor